MAEPARRRPRKKIVDVSSITLTTVTRLAENLASQIRNLSSPKTLLQVLDFRPSETSRNV